MPIKKIMTLLLVLGSQNTDLPSTDDFQKSKQFGYLAPSMQNLYRLLNAHDRIIFIETAKKFHPIIDDIFNQLGEELTSNFPYLHIYLDATEQSILQSEADRSHRIEEKVGADIDNTKLVRDKFLEIVACKLDQVKTILTSKPEIQHTLTQYCLSQNKQLFLVLAIDNPIAAVKIDLT